MNSISLSELLAAEPSVSIVLTGALASGGSVSQTFILDGILGADDFAFPAEFRNLVSVTWNQTADYHQFDNIKVTGVPIPATAWLLCSGLVGLAGVRNKIRKPWGSGRKVRHHPVDAACQFREGDSRLQCKCRSAIHGGYHVCSPGAC